jgi:hypothetical protein
VQPGIHHARTAPQTPPLWSRTGRLGKRLCVIQIDRHIAFVKDQVAVQEKLAKKYEDDQYRETVHLKAAEKFADLARFLEDIQKRGTDNTAYLKRGDSPQKRILLTFEEIENSPDELLKELNLTEADRQELLIKYLIAQAGGILSLNQIMVQLYNRTKEIPQRNTITSRLFRMAGKGMIYNIPGKKGVYSTYDVSEQDAKRLFGQTDSESEDQNPPHSPEETEPSTPPRPKLTVPKRFLSSTATIRRS